MRSFTGCARTSFTGRSLTEGGEGGAVEGKGRDGSADRVCGAGDIWRGDDQWTVPGVWDLPGDGVSLDWALPGGGESGRTSGEVQTTSSKPSADTEGGGGEGAGETSGLRLGCSQLQVLLRREGVELSERTINRILKRRGVLRPEDCHRPALKRFQRESGPTSCGRWTSRGSICCGGGGCCYPLSILDDHSRFSVGFVRLGASPATNGCEPV